MCRGHCYQGRGQCPHPERCTDGNTDYVDLLLKATVWLCALMAVALGVMGLVAWRYG